MERAEKHAEVDNLTARLSGTQIALLADFRGLTVAQITKLRRELHQSGSGGRVVKNTLAKLGAQRAFKDADSAELKKLIEIMDGPNLLIFGDSDPISPAKVVTNFSKDNKNFKVKGGWLDGAFVDAAGVEVLSKTPGREETYAKLLYLLSAPATSLARLLQTPASQLARALGAHKDNLEKA
jgi:large subunit ribosomal protein L10